ncbi:MAG: hypothetical protein M9894_28740 [Planctomycetes bacterium]|nr:hypothetical protein [Planctomycetota bacterium]
MRALAALALALVAGCSAVPTGQPERPEIYPDRTTPEAAWQTYAWAWRTGDVDVLEQVLGGWLKNDLERELETYTREKVSDYYRRDTDDLVIDEARWIHKGQSLAYLRVVLRSSAAPRLELDFAITGRGTARPSEDWVITGKRRIR